jgi:opacity protein-like surface antigen
LIRHLFCAAALAVPFLSLAPSADAVPISFTCIVDGGVGDCDIAEAQLDVELTDDGGGQATLTVTNAGPDQVVFTRVAFDDIAGVLSSISVTDTAGVDFDVDATPDNFPEGNELTPDFEPDLDAVAANPAPSNGLGVGESLDVTLTLTGSFADVLDALTDGSLRIGVRAQSFASGGSESLVNVPIPEPGTLLLLGAGLSGLVAVGRRR